MINRKKKKYLALLLAVVTMICAVAPGNGLITHAANDQQTESNNEEIKVLDRKERTDLDSDEIATAEELVIAMDYGFDVENDFEGISYEQSKATVSYDKGNSNFNGQKAGTYDTFYKVEPASGKTAYLIHRTITVKEVTTQKSASTNADQKAGATDSEEDGEADEEADPNEVVDLEQKKVSSLSIKLSSNAVMQAAAATAGTKLNIQTNILHLEKKMLFEYMYSNRECRIYGICRHSTRVIKRRRKRWAYFQTDLKS